MRSGARLMNYVACRKCGREYSVNPAAAIALYRPHHPASARVLPMQEPFAPAIAANRFGLGARPGELAQIGARAPDWLIAQLKGSPPVLADASLRSSQSVLVETLEVR